MGLDPTQLTGALAFKSRSTTAHVARPEKKRRVDSAMDGDSLLAGTLETAGPSTSRPQGHKASANDLPITPRSTPILETRHLSTQRQETRGLPVVTMTDQDPAVGSRQGRSANRRVLLESPFDKLELYQIFSASLLREFQWVLDYYVMPD